MAYSMHYFHDFVYLITLLPPSQFDWELGLFLMVYLLLVVPKTFELPIPRRPQDPESAPVGKITGEKSFQLQYWILGKIFVSQAFPTLIKFQTGRNIKSQSAQGWGMSKSRFSMTFLLSQTFTIVFGVKKIEQVVMCTSVGKPPKYKLWAVHSCIIAPEFSGNLGFFGT